ncbi:hypothetical protein HK096_011407, partial [Nowakowskiella sp. JEL0078]
MFNSIQIALLSVVLLATTTIQQTTTFAIPTLPTDTSTACATSLLGAASLTSLSCNSADAATCYCNKQYLDTVNAIFNNCPDSTIDLLLVGQNVTAAQFRTQLPVIVAACQNSTTSIAITTKAASTSQVSPTSAPVTTKASSAAVRFPQASTLISFIAICL